MGRVCSLPNCLLLVRPSADEGRSAKHSLPQSPTRQVPQPAGELVGGLDKFPLHPQGAHASVSPKAGTTPPFPGSGSVPWVGTGQHGEAVREGGSSRMPSSTHTNTNTYNPLCVLTLNSAVARLVIHVTVLGARVSNLSAWQAKRFHPSALTPRPAPRDTPSPLLRDQGEAHSHKTLDPIYTVTAKCCWCVQSSAPRHGDVMSLRCLHSETGPRLLRMPRPFATLAQRFPPGGSAAGMEAGHAEGPG